MVVTAGAFTIAASLLITLGNILWSSTRGPLAGDDPWGADTLEWSTTSPPPDYNYAYIPTVHGRYALWSEPPEAPVVTGLRNDVREVMITTILDAQPSHRHVLDGPAISPFLTALGVGVTLIGGIFTPWMVLVGAALCLPPFIAWFWPRSGPARQHTPAPP
jgi:hypothetical protein